MFKSLNVYTFVPQAQIFSFLESSLCLLIHLLLKPFYTYMYFFFSPCLHSNWKPGIQNQSCSVLKLLYTNLKFYILGSIKSGERRSRTEVIKRTGTVIKTLHHCNVCLLKYWGVTIPQKHLWTDDTFRHFIVVPKILLYY